MLVGRGLCDLSRTSVQAGVHHIHPGIGQRSGDDLGPPVVAILAELHDEHARPAALALREGLHLAARRLELAVAAALIVLFNGETHLLIPLYAIGVFIDFTISQAGMIRHWTRERPSGWQRRLAINA